MKYQSHNKLLSMFYLLSPPYCVLCSITVVVVCLKIGLQWEWESDAARSDAASSNF